MDRTNAADYGFISDFAMCFFYFVFATSDVTYSQPVLLLKYSVAMYENTQEDLLSKNNPIHDRLQEFKSEHFYCI